jgi:hypothetical protein
VRIAERTAATEQGDAGITERESMQPPRCTVRHGEIPAPHVRGCVFVYTPFPERTRARRPHPCWRRGPSWYTRNRRSTVVLRAQLLRTCAQLVRVSSLRGRNCKGTGRRQARTGVEGGRQQAALTNATTGVCRWPNT